ncbi:MAG TPA: LuxR C-terminal-related transcriptional regulator [Acidimicrobiales bacterium]|jgi:LuxR family maltose regulon positive regulatory protein
MASRRAQSVTSGERQEKSPADQPVRRERLIGLLSDASRSPFTDVNAPAGYGKSTVLHHFAQSTGQPTSWIELDAGETQAGFWRKVWAGLPPAEGREGEDSLVDDAAPLAVLDRASRLTDTTFLIFDGLDRLRDPMPFHQLSSMVHRLPTELRMLAATRQNSPLPIGKWRAQGVVAEIGAEELRFQPAETAALFESLGLTGLHPELITGLTDRAEGWPVGLHLLAASLHETSERGARAALVRLHEPTAEPLVAELLDGLAPDVVEFVLDTSVLRRFTVDLVRHVIGTEQAGRLLQTVEEANLFIVPLDEQRQWFRYRRLFAELMQRELERRHPGRAAKLRVRAAAWFEEHGDAREALGHLVAAGRAAEAFALANEDVYRPWRADSVLGTDWSEVFSLEWIEDDPARMIYYAGLLGRSGWLEQSKAWIDRAEEALRTWPAADPRQGLLLAIKALWHGVHLDAGPTLDLGHQALARLSDSTGAKLLRQRLLVSLVQARIARGELDGAALDCDAVEAGVSTELTRDLVVPAMRARIAERRGDLRQAEELGHRVLRTALAMDAPAHPAVRDGYLAIGGVLAERGRLDEAVETLAKAVALLDNQGWFAIAAAARVELAWVRAGLAGPEAGLAVLAEARELASGGLVGPELAAMLDQTEARIRLETGELDRVETLVASLPTGIERSLLEVRLALARRDAVRAAALLATVAPDQLRHQIVVELLAARLAALSPQRSIERDRRLLAAAHLAQDDGYCRTFVEEIPGLLPRLRELAEPRAELASLLTALDSCGCTTGCAATVASLTEREQAVLRYLSSSLTNQEIAAELEISVNTLKSHVRALYRKLGVGSRAAAVAVSRRANFTHRG